MGEGETHRKGRVSTISGKALDKAAVSIMTLPSELLYGQQQSTRITSPMSMET